jgi:hypothetical protein
LRRGGHSEEGFHQVFLELAVGGRGEGSSECVESRWKRAIKTEDRFKPSFIDKLIKKNFNFV